VRRRFLQQPVRFQSGDDRAIASRRDQWLAKKSPLAGTDKFGSCNATAETHPRGGAQNLDAHPSVYSSALA